MTSKMEENSVGVSSKWKILRGNFLPLWIGENVDEHTGRAIAAAANTIERWCAVRDVSALEPEAVYRAFGDECIDLMVVFGGGVIEAADLLAEAMRNGVAHRFAVVGGRGHSTWGLSDFMRDYMRTHGGQAAPEFAGLDVDHASEAEMIAAYLHREHGVAPDWLEYRSTNCGNNITFLLDLLEEKGYLPQTLILSQDAVMQRRMVATLARQVQDRPRFASMRVAGYAYYDAKLEWREGALAYAEPVPRGMWPLDHYLGLLVAEVQRLTDDEHGYGPRGRDFLVHVDVPSEVASAAADLRRLWGGAVVFGDERYAAP